MQFIIDLEHAYKDLGQKQKPQRTQNKEKHMRKDCQKQHLQLLRTVSLVFLVLLHSHEIFHQAALSEQILFMITTY